MVNMRLNNLAFKLGFQPSRFRKKLGRAAASPLGLRARWDQLIDVKILDAFMANAVHEFW